ncbi:MAG: hypothetical protein JJT96_08010 [Opitutales bacterium]|nr:hypothetical protein [Opitutales bacterium]
MNPIRPFFLRTCPFVFALAASIAPQMHGQILAVYEPDVSATVSAPIVGLGATESDYLLIHTGDWSELPKNFSGNNQEDVRFTNPATARDAASLDNDYMFQLGTDNNLRKVNLSTGAQTPFNSNNSIHLGNHTFGIGYDAGTDTLGWGRFDGSEMTFATYYVGTATFGTPVTFAFDAALYGTPTGLDYVVKNGAARMLVGTTSSEINRVLDTSALTGEVGQYFTRPLNLGNLTDVVFVYDDSKLALSYNISDFAGRLEVGDFTVIPEPNAAVWLAGLVALVAAGLLRHTRGRGRLR